MLTNKSIFSIFAFSVLFGGKNQSSNPFSRGGGGGEWREEGNYAFLILKLWRLNNCISNADL